MRVKSEITARPSEERQADAGTTNATNDANTPQKLTMAENVILTIKILAIAGLVIAALWAISFWKSVK